VKALLVSSIQRDDVQECLVAAGSIITLARDGRDAIDQAEHAVFDMAVLVSTGQVMDLMETYLNLRDIKPNMDIVILTDAEQKCEVQVQGADAITHIFPRTYSLTLDGLAYVLGLDRLP
jgi:DNA-binding response OmpR family regulator